MDIAPEIIPNAVYEINYDRAHNGMFSVTRIVDDYFYIKKISGILNLMMHDKEHDDYRIQFDSIFHKNMRIIQLPTNTEVEIKFSFDELLGE